MSFSENADDDADRETVPTDRPDSGQVRVLIVDRKTIVAESLRELFSGCADIEVVGVVSTAGDATVKTLELHPDVVLMDHQLPDADPATAVTDIKRCYPDANVMILTDSNDDYRFARRAFEAGCSGLLEKSRSVEELFSTVRATGAGEVLITPSMLKSLLPQGTFEPGGSDAGLTRRELEVLAIMAEGESNNEIAERLSISLNTARKHVQNIIGKLGAHSKLEALVIAVREGFVRPP